MTTTLQARNRAVAWGCLAAGVATGLVLGLWSFDGPVPVPARLGDYGSVARRLVRLGHIAFLGLGLINLHLARELPALRLSARAAATASRALNLGNVLLPLVLFVAAFVPPVKYLLPLPALSVFVALVLAARGAWGARP